jgi:hypothetical protein
VSTTRRTSPKHHCPFGLKAAHWQPPFFFSATIRSMMVDPAVSFQVFQNVINRVIETKTNLFCHQ